MVEKDERASEMALKAAVLRGRPSTYGADSLLVALGQGRVATLLLLLNDFSVPASICESCGKVGGRERQERCLGCGGAVSEIDLL